MDRVSGTHPPMEFFIRYRNALLRGGYTRLLKPFFFRRDPENVHDSMIRMGRRLGDSPAGRRIMARLFSYEHPSLEQTIAGIKFKNPIGLSAGFDKNAELTSILPFLGFGFAEVGSITGEPCEGNPKPRLWRLPESQSLVVYYGLKNDGAVEISRRLRGRTFGIPIGISIAKTNSPETVDTEAGIQDYLKAYREFLDIGDYITVNVSCPNSFGGAPFHEAGKLDRLLSVLGETPANKPVFIKISPDLSPGEVDAIINVARRHVIAGFVCSNLTKNRFSEAVKERLVPARGGLSAKADEDVSNDLIRHVYSRTKGEFVIVGVGGVFTADDAYRKIKLGASLIQLITGMVFQGPQVISSINYGLVRRLRADGYRSISEAVGKGV